MLIKKPRWLIQKIHSGATCRNVKNILRNIGLNTVCSEAKCPNAGECFSNGTAAFLILGDRCTRRCGFCAIGHGCPAPPDPDEPSRIAEAAAILDLDHIVITSVTRDDLRDGGAGHFAAVTEAIHSRMPDAAVELLVPDFNGSISSVETVVSASPDIIAHNIETVPRLYRYARPESDYRRSIALLHIVRKMASGIVIKSGLMLGLGEFNDEVREVMYELLGTGCSMITIGQYLQPEQSHLPVDRFVPPEEFNMWRDEAYKIGFCGVASGPFVRSSYRAAEMLRDTANHTSVPDKSQKNHRA